MVDFLGNKLEVGDNVVINQNTRTGSSTIRKMLKQCTVIGFTEHKVKTTMGNVFTEDVIKIKKDEVSISDFYNIKAHRDVIEAQKREIFTLKQRLREYGIYVE